MLPRVPYFWIRLAPPPASSSRRFVAGDDQVTCCTRGDAWLLPRASGAVVALPPLSQDVQTRCSSQKMLNLLRGVACSVSRTLAFFQVPSSPACCGLAT
jgi:hypothetical protein